MKSAKIKLSDYVIRFIENLGVKHIFLISGGGNIHLIDSIGKSKKINYVCNHHEQAASTAAEAYARIKGFGVCIVTTGPGGNQCDYRRPWCLSRFYSNAYNIRTGKKRNDRCGKITRQYGDQEVNIVDIVKPLTKYAITVMDPLEISYHLEKAVYISKSGRPGPVWIDIPLDIQGSTIETDKLKKFNTKEIKPDFGTDKKKLKELVAKTIDKIKNSKRPVLYAGNGIRLAGAYKQFLSLVELLKIPVLTSYAGYDLMPSAHPYFFRQGTCFWTKSRKFRFTK